MVSACYLIDDYLNERCRNLHKKDFVRVRTARSVSLRQRSSRRRKAWSRLRKSPEANSERARQYMRLKTQTCSETPTYENCALVHFASALVPNLRLNTDYPLRYHGLSVSRCTFLRKVSAYRIWIGTVLLEVRWRSKMFSTFGGRYVGFWLFGRCTFFKRIAARVSATMSNA